MTQEEAKEYLDNYRKMYAELAPERFLEALDIMLNEPSLPSNLDEAAKDILCAVINGHISADVSFAIQYADELIKQLKKQ